MGAITLPDRGPIYMDACGFIYSVERIEPYRALIEPVWRRAQIGQFSIVTGELSIVETMVKPPDGMDFVGSRFFQSALAQDANDARIVRTTEAFG